MLTQKRKDMLSDKFDIGSSVINKESLNANLQTVEYLVKNLVPTLMKKVNTSPLECNTKTNYGEKTNILKTLLENLTNYLKEIKTEVNIQTFLDNLNEQNQKNLDSIESLDEKSVKYEFSLPTLDMKSSKKIHLIAPVSSSSKFECLYENCKKVYSSHDTLLYHMKTKHKKGDVKKGDTKIKIPCGEITIVKQRERRKTRNEASEPKIITQKNSQKAPEFDKKTPKEKSTHKTEDQIFYSNPNHNKKNSQSANQKKNAKVYEPLSKDDRLLGKKLRSSGGPISVSKNLFDRDLQPNVRKKNFVLKNIRVQMNYDSSNQGPDKSYDNYYENISTEDTSKNPLIIKKMSPDKTCDIDQSNINLNNNTSKILEDFAMNNDSDLLLPQNNLIKLNNRLDNKNNSYLFDQNIENDELINQEDGNLCFRPERKNSERNFLCLLNDNIASLNHDENMMRMDTFYLGLDNDEEAGNSFQQLPNDEKANLQMLDSSSVDIDVLLSNNEQRRKYSSGSLIGTF